MTVMSRQRGQHAGLTRAAVVDAACALAQREGIGALSMRRCAAHLGVAPNALYTHVPDKATLVDLVVEAALAELPAPEDDGWRRRLEGILTALHHALAGRPDMAAHLLTRPGDGPEAVRIRHEIVTALGEAGVSPPRQADAAHTMMVFTLGAACATTKVEEGSGPHRAFHDGLAWMLDGIARAR